MLVARIVTRPSSKGRGAWLVQSTTHAPPVVLQDGWITPPSVEKIMVVPSGTGLLKWSAARIIIGTETPSVFHASGFSVSALTEKLSWSGRPVLTAISSESVDIGMPVTVASTRTWVVTVPA